jgi:phenylalanyl-tRNA synthetase beta chain
MKFTLDWLKDHLETTLPVAEIARMLDQIGLEVESVEDPAAALAAFTIARVLDAKRHPNADKLQVLQVEVAPGKPPLEVVCGAPNARAGMIGVFAPLGAYIPGTGITLEAKPVRGVVSNGMMLSEREMQLSDDHKGIVDLDMALASKVGEKYADALGLGDVVLDVKLTPNRPDCTGVRGIARDLAAAGVGKLKAERKLRAVEGKTPCAIDIRLEFTPETAAACPCFAGRTIKGIDNTKGSPDWMQRRLKAIGQRPINAVVDVTNYIMIDRGRPLHVYDLDKLTGPIRARMARDGETVLALNGKTYTLDSSMCVIADDAGVHDIGGVLGGEHTGCTEATTNILIECAYFDPRAIAATGRKLELTSDARYRFERGVDPGFIEPGLDLATSLMLEVAGGTPSKRAIAGSPPLRPLVIDFDFGRVEKIMGLTLPLAEMRRTLTDLGFAIEGKGATAKVEVPSWRHDVSGAADLVEEIARIAGLQSVPSSPLPWLGGLTKATLTQGQRRVRRARRTLAARGMVEAITWSFIDGALAVHFGGGGDALTLANPISSDMTTMRPSLLAGLTAAAARNRNRGFADLALFEVGQAYRGDGADEQMMIAAGVRAGASRLTGSGRHWRDPAPAADVFDVKGDAMAVLTALGFDPARAQITRDAPAWYHPGRSGTLRLGPKVVLAHFGALHPATAAALDIAEPVSAFEVFLDALPGEKAKPTRAKPALTLSDLLPVTRDFAFLVDASIAAHDLVRAAHSADKARITGVGVFDVYEGKGVPDGKKSVAIEVTIAQTDKTLTDQEIDAIGRAVVSAVTSATGAEMRG